MDITIKLNDMITTASKISATTYEIENVLGNCEKFVKSNFSSKTEHFGII